MIARRLQTLLWMVALLATALASGCGWTPRLSFASPHKTYRLELTSPRVAKNSDLRLDLVAGNGTRYTIYRVGHEMPLDFAYTYWGPNEERLAFVGCGGGSVVQVAYDLKNHEPLAFDEVAGQVRTALQSDYPPRTGLDATLDPIAAACVTIQWHEEFEKRYGL